MGSSRIQFQNIVCSQFSEAALLTLFPASFDQEAAERCFGAPAGRLLDKLTKRGFLLFHPTWHTSLEPRFETSALLITGKEFCKHGGERNFLRSEMDAA